MEGSWVTVKCVSDDDPCVHEKRARSWEAHASASSFLLNNYSETFTLNGFDETRRRGGMWLHVPAIAMSQPHHVMVQSWLIEVGADQQESDYRTGNDWTWREAHASLGCRVMKPSQRGKTSNIKVSDLSASAEVRYGQILTFLPTFFWLLTSRRHHSDDSGAGWALDQHSHLYPPPPALPRGPSLEMSPASSPGLTCSPRAQMHRNYTTNYTVQTLGPALTPVSTQKMLIRINKAHFIVMLNNSTKVYIRT